jgi:hypothetical protein
MERPILACGCGWCLGHVGVSNIFQMPSLTAFQPGDGCAGPPGCIGGTHSLIERQLLDHPSVNPRIPIHRRKELAARS